MTVPANTVAADRVRAAISASDLALGLRIIADLLEAGLPVRRVLAAFVTVSPAAWRPAIPHLQESMKVGRSVAAALGDAPIEIPPLVIGIVAAGEAGNGLAAAIRRAAELTESTAAVRAAVRGALAYPMLLAAAGAGAVALMVGVVLPRFAAILADLDQMLPASTRMVLQLTSVTRASFGPVVCAALAIVVAIRAWKATDEGRRRWDALLLQLPLGGSVRFSASTARAAFSLATLLDSGVAIRSALAFAARASGDAEVEARLLAARDRVAGGESVASAFAAVQALTPFAVRLVSAGEQSGQLARMLAHAAKLEQERSERLVRTAVRLLEPALVLVFASIVALVAAALLQAVYSIRPT